jgi:hypothetical protein
MKGVQITYTTKELTWIERNKELPRKEAHEKFCKKFNRGDVSLVNFKALCTRKGWKTGRTGCYEKGQTPHNAGKKMSYNANSARTQFKKGQEPHNTKFEGYERVTVDGYIEISIAQTNPHTGFKRRFALKHRYLWEQKNGELPEGMCLKCLDGDRQNTSPENWVAIPRQALPFLVEGRWGGYDYDKMPDELKPTVLALAKVRGEKSRLTKQKTK